MIQLGNCKLYNSDCFDVLPDLESKSVQLILADLPYGVTKNPEDKQLPFDKLWLEYNRIIKDDGVIALFSQGLFYVDLVNSNRKDFKYDLVWNKGLVSGFLNAKRMPLRSHENIAIFYKKQPKYNPQFTEGKPLHSKGKSFLTNQPTNRNYGKLHHSDDSRAGETKKYPKSIINFNKPHPSVALHRTEKPIDLLEWIIKTYTDESDLVLDNVMGSGSTIVAAINTKRSAIGIEKNSECFDIALDRIKKIYTFVND